MKNSARAFTHHCGFRLISAPVLNGSLSTQRLVFTLHHCNARPWHRLPHRLFPLRKILDTKKLHSLRFTHRPNCSGSLHLRRSTLRKLLLLGRLLLILPTGSFRPANHERKLHRQYLQHWLLHLVHPSRYHHPLDRPIQTSSTRSTPFDDSRRRPYGLLPPTRP